MAVDTPAKIAILGAGPIGLEAALYARFLGYEVEVFDFQFAAAQQAARAAQRMATPFRENCSRLGINALHAQNPGHVLPPADGVLTYQEWYSSYLLPLADTDLLADCLRLNINVSQVGKVALKKSDCPQGEYDRGAWDFRLRVTNNATAEESITTADVVLDCGGVFPLPLGLGGLFVPGESELRRSEGVAVQDDLSSVLHCEGGAVLVVGDHPVSAETVNTLADIRQAHPLTRITWITPQERTECPCGPLGDVGSDAIELWRESVQSANRLAQSDRITWSPGTWVEAIRRTDSRNQFVVQLAGDHPGKAVFDHVIDRNGFTPLWHEATELQLDICPITDAPRPFSEYLLKRPSPYSVEYPAPDASALITSEPNYYVLGSKSFGRMPGFLYQHGLRQIRDVFTIIGDRADLDLYAQMK